MSAWMGLSVNEYRARDRDCTDKASSAFAAVTRLVLEKYGVLTEYWADSWLVDVQDGGRTVKLFACGSGASAAKSAAEWLGGSVVSAPTASSSDPAIATALQERHAAAQAERDGA